MLTFPTPLPLDLLNALFKAITDGRVATWERDVDGDFTHTASVWRYRAFMRPTVVAATALQFSIMFNIKEKQKRLVYAYYHGHLLEIFLTHFPDYIATSAHATPNPKGKDSTF